MSTDGCSVCMPIIIILRNLKREAGLKDQIYKYRWVPLKLDFLGARKSVWLKSNPAYPVIFSLVYKEKLPSPGIQLN